MRHSIHIFFNETSSEVLLSMQEYIEKYAKNDVKQYITLLQYKTTKDTIIVKKTKPYIAQKITFTSAVRDLKSELIEHKSIPNDKDIEQSLELFVDELWSERINAETQDDKKLSFFLYVQLDDESTWSQCEKLITTIREKLNDAFKCSIEVICFSADLAKIFHSKEILANENWLAQNNVHLNKNAQDTFNKIAKVKKDTRTLFVDNYIFIADKNNDYAIEFTISSLSCVLGEYALLNVTASGEIYSASRTTEFATLFGISIARIDDFYIKQYLLQKSFLQILQDENISVTEIELSWASKFVDEKLRKQTTILSDIFKDKVSSEECKGLDQNAIFAKINEYVKARFANISEELQSIIQSDDLTLVQKKAILYALEGEDEALFGASTLPDSKQTISMDLQKESIDFYVDINNKVLYDENLCDKAILPTLPEKLQVEPRTISAKNVNDDIKQIRYELRNDIADIRKTEDEIEELKKSIQQEDDSQKCLIETGEVIFGEKKYKLLPHVDEPPLVDSYEAQDVTIPSVDLSMAFPEIKDQGEQGSCLSFSLVTAFEYLYKQKEQESINLSEQFLYYVSREKAGESDIDAGSNIKYALEALTEVGICKEEFWKYGEHGYDERPSDEAYEDAKNRLVKKSLKVAYSANDVKSALCDGFPVVISALVTDSFTQAKKGFIPMPSDDEIARATENTKVGCNHAIVICGFDDQYKLFKFRNSWGTQWGDNGYGYLPYEFIENQKTTNWLVLINDIELSQIVIQNKIKVEPSKYQTVKKETELHFEIANDVIRCELKKRFLQQKLYEKNQRESTLHDLSKYYYEVLTNCGDTNKCTSLCNAYGEVLDAQIQKKTEEIKGLDADYSQTIASIEGKYKKYILLILVIASIVGIGLHVFESMFIGAIVIGLIVLVIGILLWYVLRKHEMDNVGNDYNRQRKQLHIEKRKLEDEQENLFLKKKIADEIILEHDKAEVKWKSYMRGIEHFINNLNTWKLLTIEEHKTMKAADTMPFVSIFENTDADEFFNEKKSELLKDIKLKDFIVGYEPSEEGIIAVQQNIKNTLLQRINNTLPKFCTSVYEKHITDELLQKVKQKSMPFNPYKESEEISSNIKIFVDDTMKKEARETIRKTMSDATVCDVDFPLELVMLQTIDVKKEEIEDFF